MTLLRRLLAPAFDADGMVEATRSMQQGLNILNDGDLPSLKEDGAWGPVTDFTFKKSVAGRGGGRVEEAFALGRLQSLAKNPQTPETLSKRARGILGPLDGRNPHHALALQMGLNEIGPRYDKGFAPLKLDGEIGPKTTDAFNRLSKAAGPFALASDFGKAMGWR